MSTGHTIVSLTKPSYWRKMSKLLRIANTGQIHSCAGKSLNEIHLGENEILEDAEEDCDREEEPESNETEKGSDVSSVQKTRPNNEGHQISRDKDTRNYRKWTQHQQAFLLNQPEIQKLLKTKSVPNKQTGETTIQRSKGLLHDKVRDIS